MNENLTVSTALAAFTLRPDATPAPSCGYCLRPTDGPYCSDCVQYLRLDKKRRAVHDLTSFNLEQHAAVMREFHGPSDSNPEESEVTDLRYSNITFRFTPGSLDVPIFQHGQQIGMLHINRSNIATAADAAAAWIQSA